MKKIKEMLLADDTTLLNVVEQLHNYNGIFAELEYWGEDGKNYKMINTNKIFLLDEIIDIHKKKIDEIIIAMLENYNNIDICNSELEDYIEENNLV